MSEDTFIAIGADIEWCFRWMKWPFAITVALLALVLTEGW